MKNINLNDCLFGEKDINITLEKFFVSIVFLGNNRDVYYHLCITNKNGNTLVCEFRSLSEALNFVDEVLVYCNGFGQIMDEYQDRYCYCKNKSLKRRFS